MAFQGESDPTNRSIRRPPSPRLRRLLIQTGTVLVFVCGGLFGVVWWEERLVRMAASHLRNGDLIQASQSIDEFLIDHPDHDRALALKARVLVEEGQPRQAISLFEQVGASDPQDLHAWAKALLQIEQWSAALPLLKLVEQSGIDRADTLHELAACRMKLGDVDKALQSAEEFSKQPNCEARGQLLIGTIHQQRGNLRAAASAWDRVLKLTPEIVDLQIPPEEFFREYGRVLLALGEPSLAETYLNRSLLLQRTSGSLVSLGEAQFQLGREADAQRSFEEALRDEPHSVPARKGLANLALAKGDAQRAVELLLPLENSGVLTSEIAFLLQRCYVRLKDEPAAKRWQERADQCRKQENIRSAADQILRDTPDSSWATVIRAYKYANLGNWTEAETLLKSLDQASQSQPFIRDLAEAVQARSELPSLQGLPIRDH